MPEAAAESGPDDASMDERSDGDEENEEDGDGSDASDASDGSRYSEVGAAPALAADVESPYTTWSNASLYLC